MIYFIIYLIIIGLFWFYFNRKNDLIKEFIKIQEHEDVIEKILLYKNKIKEDNTININKKNEVDKKIEEIDNFIKNSVFNKGK